MSDRDQQQQEAAGNRGDTGMGGREGYGDGGGSRIGRPDQGRADERATSDSSMARLSHNAGGADAEEGSILDDEAGNASGTRGGRSEMRADGSSMTGADQTLDHAQRAQSGTPERGSGAGAEGAQGVHSRQGGQSAPRGDDRAGSEPLEGREREHKGSYGGEGGAPRTSSDQRENPNDPRVR